MTIRGTRRTRRRAGRAQRGLSESVQWAVLTPLLLLVVLGIVHSGIWLHGRNVAANAALAGAEAQSLSGAGSDVGGSVARDVAQRGGLRDVQVSSSRSGGEVVVVVTGRVDSFYSLGTTEVSSRAEMPEERVR